MLSFRRAPYTGALGLFVLALFAGIALTLFAGIWQADVAEARRGLGPDEARPSAPKPQLDQPTSDDPLAFLFRWQKDLSKSMPSAVAWVALAAPFWLPFCIWLLVINLRRRRRRRVLATPSEPPLPRLPEVSRDAPPPLELTGEQDLLARQNNAASLYETFVALGPTAEAVAAWRRVASEELTPELWSALVAGQHENLLPRLRARWLKRLARERIRVWLLAHDVITRDSLDIQLPDDLEVASLNELGLVGHDGLGIDPDGPQDELLRETRRLLALAYRGADSPYSLELLSKRTGSRALLLGADEHSELPSTHALAVLLCGLPVLERAAAAGLFDKALGNRLRAVLAEAKAVDVPAEGCASHALLGLPAPEPPGIGMLLAALTGAAIGPASVALAISRELGAVSAAPLERLGHLAAKALAEPHDLGGQHINHQLLDLLGQQRLEQEHQRARALEHDIERRAHKEPLWPAVSGSRAPDVALVQLHRRKVEHVLAQVQTASACLTRVLAKVAYAGRTKSDQSIAAGRLGYALAGLGNLAADFDDEGMTIAWDAAQAVLYPSAKR